MKQIWAELHDLHPTQDIAGEIPLSSFIDRLTVVHLRYLLSTHRMGVSGCDRQSLLNALHSHICTSSCPGLTVFIRAELPTCPHCMVPDLGSHDTRLPSPNPGADPLP